MQPPPDLDSKNFENPWATGTIKMLRGAGPWTLLLPAQKRGCSSVVEHLLAKEDVASSSLVTRCFLRV
jgi:hypothetical protein